MESLYSRQRQEKRRAGTHREKNLCLDLTRRRAARLPPPILSYQSGHRPDLRRGGLGIFLLAARLVLLRALFFLFPFCLRRRPAGPSIEAAVKQLGDEDGEAKLEAINKLVAAADVAAIHISRQCRMKLPRVQRTGLIVADGKVTKDALTGAAVNAPADNLEALIVNNRIRGALEGAIAALKLISPDRAKTPGCRESGSRGCQRRNVAADQKRS